MAVRVLLRIQQPT